MLHHRRPEPEVQPATFLPKRAITSAVIAILLIFFLLLTTALAFSALSYHQLRQGNIRSAAHAARVAIFPVTTFSLLTFHQIPDVEIWRSGLELVQHLPDNLTAFQAFTSQSLLPAYQTDVTNAEIAQRVQSLSAQTQEMLELSQKSVIAQHFFPSADTVGPILQDLNLLSQTFLRDTHRYLILLQNSDELRATGGFMGSYAIVELHEGKIQTLEIQDIYEPDGQFTGFIDPPSGVEEYLSGGKGWRLPDANWYADFPTAAKDITRFFTLGKQKEVDGVIAINVQAMEELLRITGDLYLPDQKMTVTPENLAQVARADRESFFPGSKQKTNFLSSLFTQLKIRLSELTPDQYQRLAKRSIAQAQQKNLQFYTAEPKIQALFEKYAIDGAMQLEDNPYLFLVESNVGINKTNREVHREVHLTFGEHRSQLEVTFHNNNQPLPAPTQQEKHKGYINYQRLYLPAEAIVDRITIGGQPIPKWDEAIFVSSKNQRFKEIGFLVTVPELSEQKVLIEYLHPQLIAPFTLQIQKQSGLPPTPYTIQFHDDTKNFLLETDTMLQFTP